MEIEENPLSGSSGEHKRQEMALETDGLSKSFSRGHFVVNEVSLRVPKASVFGFLGPNGSGKTTTIRMILGLVSPDSGGVSILGESRHPQSQLARVGAVVEGPGFYPYLTGLQNLRRFADIAYPAQLKLNRGIKSLSKSDLLSALSKVGLSDAANKKFRAYSLGMKQRLAVSAALLWPRDLLVLDEPTNGLDPQGIVEVRELVSSLRGEGMTIFISSHILSEVEMICSDIGVMRDGKLLFQGSTDQFRESLGSLFNLVTNDVSLARNILENGNFVDAPSIIVEGDTLKAQLGGFEIESIVKALVDGGVGIRGVGMTVPSLEEAFVELTGRSGHAR